MSYHEQAWLYGIFNPSPAEPGYALPLQTVLIQISWLLKKPTDLICTVCHEVCDLDQVI